MGCKGRSATYVEFTASSVDGSFDALHGNPYRSRGFAAKKAFRVRRGTSTRNESGEGEGVVTGGLTCLRKALTAQT